MAYDPYEWECGETITAEKLNRIEEAIAELSQGGSGLEPMYVEWDHYDQPRTYYNYTWREVYEGFKQGRLVYWGVDNMDENHAELSPLTFMAWYGNVVGGVVVFGVDDVGNQGFAVSLRADSLDGYLYEIGEE